MNLKFPEGFLWGVASSAYQVEGAYNEDGKGESIWDRFTHIPGKTVDTGDVSCDHYHRYKEDVELLKYLDVKAYRFSISWTRVFPEGYGKPNVKGMEFYKNLVNLLLENGIKPTITLYHWDLPQKLQDIGGWANPLVSDYFEQYARYVFSELGELVPIWITHNEPWVAAFMGYATGKFAPGISDYTTALLVSHNILLSHGKAVKAYREMGFKGEIGITLDLFPPRPASSNEEDIKAARRDTASHLSWFADPVFKGCYPKDMVEWYKEKGIQLPDYSEKDLELISTPVDFLGINYYAGSVIKNAPGENWPMDTRYINKDIRKDSKTYRIHAENLYDYLLYLNEEYKGVKIIITENGFSCLDFVDRNGEVNDLGRIDYLYRHLAEAQKAILSGVNLSGYYTWSFLDSYEWSGYNTRMGLVYVDYDTQRRTIKKSGHWYKQVIAANSLISDI
jgi:beta-glucosidase